MLLRVDAANSHVPPELVVRPSEAGATEVWRVEATHAAMHARLCVQRIQRRHLFLAQLDVLSVSQSVRASHITITQTFFTWRFFRRRSLWMLFGTTALHAPAQQHLRTRHRCTMGAGNGSDGRVLCRVRVLANGRVRGEDDAARGAEGKQVVLGQGRVQLDLVHRGDDSDGGMGEQGFERPDAKVRHADRLCGA